MRVVDCTLRDGGYYNAWDFPPALVNRYLAATAAAGVDVAEIGFRSYPQDRFLGAFAYSTDELLRSLDVPEPLTLGVMVNAADVLAHPGSPAAAVDELFAAAADSPVSVVRIAAHLGEAIRVEPHVRRLHDLGYRVGVNLMQASRFPTEQITATADQIAGWGTVEVLYFADSLGNMTEADVRTTFGAVRAGWPGPIGVHTHDNRGRALANTLVALDTGATWLDATVRGMGRGPGNTRTEFLCFELARRGHARYRAEALLGIDPDFAALQQRHGWGTNLLYFIAAAEEIHPTYVQMLLADDRYGTADVVDVLHGLRDLEGHSFSAERLLRAVEGAGAAAHGTWDATGWLQDRDVLLLASGPSLRAHADAIRRFVARDQPAVLALNATGAVPDDLVSAYVACHPTRLLLDAPRLAALRRPLIAPAASLQALLADTTTLDVLDYGIAVERGKFVAESHGCVLPARLVIAYAMAAATAAGARRLLLAGVDGYPAGDARQDEMVEVFAAYHAMPGSLPVVAITPTTYPIAQGSVYAPTV